MAMSHAATRSRGWWSEDDCRLDDFVAVVQQRTDLDDYPFADAVTENVALPPGATVMSLGWALMVGATLVDPL